MIGVLAPDSSLKAPPSEYSSAMSEFRDAFRESNLVDAHFPAAIQPYRSAGLPHSPKDSTYCEPRAPW
jgi:hypothetical protein